MANESWHICFDCAFLNHKWEPCHVTIGLFEIVNTYGFAMAMQMNDVLVEYGFNAKIVPYVKGEESNLSTMINVLTYVVSFEMLGLSTLFLGSCWG